MINYIKNSFKDIIKNCDKVNKVSTSGIMMPLDGSPVNFLYNYCSIMVDLTINMKDLKLSPEGRLNAIPSFFPKDIWMFVAQIDLYSCDDEYDKYNIKVFFNMNLADLKLNIDKAIEKAYFDVVEEVLQET